MVGTSNKPVPEMAIHEKFGYFWDTPPFKQYFQ